jgi:hypothetical protein
MGLHQDPIFRVNFEFNTLEEWEVVAVGGRYTAIY